MQQAEPRSPTPPPIFLDLDYQPTDIGRSNIAPQNWFQQPPPAPIQTPHIPRHTEYSPQQPQTNWTSSSYYDTNYPQVTDMTPQNWFRQPTTPPAPRQAPYTPTPLPTHTGTATTTTLPVHTEHTQMVRMHYYPKYCQF